MKADTFRPGIHFKAEVRKAEIGVNERKLRESVWIAAPTCGPGPNSFKTSVFPGNQHQT
jgi:hypothetical protein